MSTTNMNGSVRLNPLDFRRCSEEKQSVFSSENPILWTWEFAALVEKERYVSMEINSRVILLQRIVSLSLNFEYKRAIPKIALFCFCLQNILSRFQF